MRRANGVLNALGMCCAMTTPGESGGSRMSTSLIASVPPVEAPIAMTRSVVRNGRARGGAFGSTASALWAGPTAPGARGCLGSSARTLAQAAIRIFSMSSSA